MADGGSACPVDNRVFPVLSSSIPMTERSDERAWLSTVSLLVLAGVALAVALIYTRAVMVPFVLALLFSYLVSPIVDTMQTRLRMPRGVSILVADPSIRMQKIWIRVRCRFTHGFWIAPSSPPE